MTTRHDFFFLLLLVLTSKIHPKKRAKHHQQQYTKESESSKIIHLRWELWVAYANPQHTHTIFLVLPLLFFAPLIYIIPNPQAHSSPIFRHSTAKHNRWWMLSRIIFPSCVFVFTHINMRRYVLLEKKKLLIEMKGWREGE